jgi:hypothetical protein
MAEKMHMLQPAGWDSSPLFVSRLELCCPAAWQGLWPQQVID